MSSGKARLEEVLTRLETERDELKVKLGLAKLEAREEWQELEKKIETLRSRMKVVGDEAKDASGDVGAAVDQLTEEIKGGFERIRKLM